MVPVAIAGVAEPRRPSQRAAASPAPLGGAAVGSTHRSASETSPTEKVSLSNLPLDSLGVADNRVAWTVDDGLTPEVIGAYVQLLQTTDVRLTFFVTGSYEGWRQYADQLKPFVQSGRVQLANHTWSHPDLLSLTDEQIVDELERTEEFLLDTFGVSAKPYYRPPMGRRDARTDAAAANIGYTVPVLWTDWLDDSLPTTPSALLAAAKRAFVQDAIVLSHANEFAEIDVLPDIYLLIRERELQTVTLNDVFVSH
nr:polysaccharide deacetylase family protein [Lysinibacter cavernae]